MDQMKEWVQDAFNPVVVVAATPAAEGICTSKNGLSVVDLLRPFSHVPRVKASVRMGDQAVKLQDLKLRLHAMDTLHQPKLEALEEHLKGVLQSAAQKYVRLDAPADVIATVTAGGSTTQAELTPWYIDYREELLRVSAWGDHSTLDHPVGAILVAPADVMNPLQCFEKLLADMVLPPLMKQEVMYPIKDREFPRHYLLLQDGSNPLVDDRRAAENLALLRRTFGEASASLLKINTGTGDRAGAGAPPEFFTKSLKPCLPGGGAGEPESRPPPPPAGAGVWLSSADLDAAAATLRAFAVNLLLPRLEERAAKLNAAVTATRRGLRNRITRLWKGPADEAAADKPYLWHSVESQMRQLADLAFMLHAYEFAAETYRLASQDYLAANNYRWYAGAEEMRGLSVVMAPNDNDPAKYFGRAVDNYSRLSGRSARLLATRAALLAARFHRAAGRHLAASAVLMRPHQEEEGSRAAVLLEQSAYCLLRTSPPSIRKCAFHMVMAGLRYNAAGLKKLGMNSYRLVLGIYAGRGWRAIEEHVHDVGGKLCREAGDEAGAATHFLALLQDCRLGRPAPLQAHYLGQLLDSARKAAAKGGAAGGVAALEGLRLPLIDPRDVVVIFDDTGCAGNVAATSAPAATWAALEACVSADPNMLRDAATAAAKQQTQDHEEFNACAAGEAVSVRLALRNPLGVKLRLAALRLVAEFTPLDDNQQPMTAPQYSPSSPPQGMLLGDGAHPLAGSAVGPSSLKGRSPFLHQQEVRLNLHPGEAVRELLSVTPLAAGWLRILGVTWVLEGGLEGHLDLAPRGRLRKHAKGPRPSQQRHYPPSRRLLFSVAPASVRLQLLADPLPSTMFRGEFQRVVMLVRNVGGMPCRNLQLVVSSSEAAVATPSSGSRNGSSDSSLLPETASLAEQLHDPTNSISPMTLPESGPLAYRCGKGAGAQLAPGETLPWVVWLHPRGAGTLPLHLLWYCEPEGPSVPSMIGATPGGGSGTGVGPGGCGGAPLRFRTLRTSHTVKVRPVVVVRPAMGPLAGQLEGHLLRLECETPPDVDPVTISQVTALTAGLSGSGLGSKPGGGWRLSVGAAPTGTDSDQAVAGPWAEMPSVGRHTLLPGTLLQPGSTLSSAFVLQPPSGTPSTVNGVSNGLGGGSQGAGVQGQDQESAAVAAQALQGLGISDQAPVQADHTRRRAVLNLVGNLQGNGGPLAHWYPPQWGPVAGGARTEQGQHGSSMKGSRGAAAAATAAQQGGGKGGRLRPGPAHADPALDVAVVWQTAAVPAVASVGQPGLGGGGAPARLGVLLLHDLTRAEQPLAQPLRLSLQRAPVPGEGGRGAVVRHDFRRSAMCVVSLQLSARNCAGTPISLTVQAGRNVQGATPHAWTVTAPSAHGEAAGPSGGMGPGGVAAHGPAIPSLLQAGLQPGDDYTWCGRTCIHVDELAPGACCHVALRVAVFKPGTYPIGGCMVNFSLPGGLRDTMHVEQLLMRVDAT